MIKFVIHVGLPRTGTTVIQKHALPLCRNNYVITKAPFQGSASTTFTGGTEVSLMTLKSQLDSQDISLEKGTNNKALLDMFIKMSGALAINEFKYQRLYKIMTDSITSIMRFTIPCGIFLSSERLIDNTASLDGNSRHLENEDKEFIIYPFLRCFNGLSSPLISICLRDPIAYLSSRYIRTMIQRNHKGLIHLSPSKYIAKQSTLENNSPGTSTLTHAMHEKFLNQLRKFATVKAFGFQELISTKDLFDLLGLEGENQIAFQGFPRENESIVDKDSKKIISDEIVLALKEYGYYSTIMKSKLYD